MADATDSCYTGDTRLINWSLTRWQRDKQDCRWSQRRSAARWHGEQQRQPTRVSSLQAPSTPIWVFVYAQCLWVLLYGAKETRLYQSTYSTDTKRPIQVSCQLGRLHRQGSPNWAEGDKDLGHQAFYIWSVPAGIAQSQRVDKTRSD